MKYFFRITPVKGLYKNERINKYIQYLFISQLKRKKKIKYFCGYVLKTEKKHKRVVFKRNKLYK